jgi:hypothetical protein
MMPRNKESVIFISWNIILNALYNPTNHLAHRRRPPLIRGPQFENTIILLLQTGRYKGKIKLFLFSTDKALCHEGTLGSGCLAPPYLTLPLYGGEWSASRLSHPVPWESTPPPNNRLGGPAEQRTEKSCPCRESKSGRPACRLQLYRPRYSDSCVQAHYVLLPQLL